ncbi:hypothetical protein ACQV2X_05055 [Facklamia sp. P12945]|uniref:hypothetical protein n=1 Tax=unclassified Facklamia TaxID=2622293 RepID=UPI003D16553B
MAKFLPILFKQLAIARGWVLAYSVHSGNTYDTLAFPFLFEKIPSFNPTYLIADAGYTTPINAHFL